jgi:hypothetical protein
MFSYFFEQTDTFYSILSKWKQRWPPYSNFLIYNFMTVEQLISLKRHFEKT